MNSIGKQSVVCRHKTDPKKSLNFVVENQVDELSSTVFVILSIEKPETATYKIQNKCQNVSL
jgi:hypothetical protein